MQLVSFHDSRFFFLARLSLPSVNETKSNNQSKNSAPSFNVSSSGGGGGRTLRRPISLCLRQKSTMVAPSVLPAHPKEEEVDRALRRPISLCLRQKSTMVAPSVAPARPKEEEVDGKIVSFEWNLANRNELIRVEIIIDEVDAS